MARLSRRIAGKHQTRFDGFDDKIVSLYARGVLEEVKAWQNRPLEPLYAIVYLDALYVKMRHKGRVENRAVYVAVGVDVKGRKEVLGLWTSANEGAKF
jgi:putative transposase